MKSRGFWVPLGTAQTPDHHFFGTRRGARGRATCARVGRPRTEERGAGVSSTHGLIGFARAGPLAPVTTRTARILARY